MESSEEENWSGSWGDAQDKQIVESHRPTLTDSAKPRIIALHNFDSQILQRIREAIRNKGRIITVVERHNDNPATRADFIVLFSKTTTDVASLPSISPSSWIIYNRVTTAYRNFFLRVFEITLINFRSLMRHRFLLRHYH